MHKILKKNRLVFKRGNSYFPLSLQEIAFFYCKGIVVIAVDGHSNQFACDKNLAKLSLILPEEIFFRATRQYFVNVAYIHSYKITKQYTLEVSLKDVKIDCPILISQKLSPFFLKWLREE
jgi:DNA-binding LytR/AlgR family response regulator